MPLETAGELTDRKSHDAGPFSEIEMLIQSLFCEVEDLLELRVP